SRGTSYATPSPEVGKSNRLSLARSKSTRRSPVPTSQKAAPRRGSRPFAANEQRRRAKNRCTQESVMLYFQNTLLLLGAAALGAIACGPGLVYFLAASVLRPRRPEDWGAAFLVIPLLGCGSVLGAIFGAVAAIRWITTQDDGLWKPRVWIGA